MRDAQIALNGAEKEFKDHGDEPSTRNAAYIAQRKVVAAEAKGQTMGNLQQKKELEANLARSKDDQLARTRGDLDSTRGQLARTEMDAQSERAARVAAEKKANDALSAINGLKTSQDERGLVLTLSGSVLFATNSTALLPVAKTRLTEVATALKEDKRAIAVYGHTDSTGGDDLNQKLSEGRAASVKTFLSQQGVPADRITSTGMGKGQPIADNASPEGRANNRRVEIVLKNAR
jgi:outer membrane protein OmpA-like peptidoglycan-associated protein